MHGVRREGLANTLILWAPARNGTLTLCAPLCAVRIWCRVDSWRRCRPSEVSEASWRSRQAPTALTSLQGCADIVPDIQRLASGSRLGLSWLVFERELI